MAPEVAIIIILLSAGGALGSDNDNMSCKCCECQFSDDQLLSKIIDTKIAEALNNSLTVDSMFNATMLSESDIESLIERKINASLINNPQAGELNMKLQLLPAVIVFFFSLLFV